LDRRRMAARGSEKRIPACSIPSVPQPPFFGTDHAPPNSNRNERRGILLHRVHQLRIVRGNGRVGVTE
jgi:hypothetical protein